MQADQTLPGIRQVPFGALGALPRDRFPGRHPFVLIGVCAVWMAFVGNAPLWLELGRLSLLEQARDWAFAGALALIMVSCLTGLLSLLAWHGTLKPVLVGLLLATATTAFFMLRYGVVIDSTMLVNVLQTDPQETLDLLSLGFMLNLILMGLLPALLVARYPLALRPWRQSARQNLLLFLLSLFVLSITVFLALQPLASNMRNHRQLRYLMNPLNLIYASAQIASAPLRQQGGAPAKIGLDAHVDKVSATQARPPLLALVIGETARSANFGLNGYPRATTPELEREQLASFRNVSSCGTSTAVSLPCMFSHLDQAGFAARSGNSENLLDIIERAGMAVLWLENQSGCKGVCDRVTSAVTSTLNDPRWCQGGECFDAIMLEGLERRIEALDPVRRARGVVVVMHQMGSHGPAYFRRSPAAFKRFLPECASADLQNCQRQELLNAYDNSIAYTDHFLASTIAWLRHHDSAFDTAMLYVSDHGESLGENNIYLHGLPYAIAPVVQKKVPWVTWLSHSFELRAAVRTECLQAQRDRPLSHDHFFHSVLGLLKIQTGLYQRRLDAYAPCASL